MAPEVWILGFILALPVVAYAFYRVGRTVDERTVPFMALLAAGIFVAQMLNFPVGGGTTGHLVGATLAVLLLGTWGGVVVMTVILTIQCLVFGDGGITALGLNLLNMAVIAPLVTGGILYVFRGKFALPATSAAAWTSVFLGAFAAAVELGLSYSISGGEYGMAMSLAVPAMLGWHLFIGIGEAIITVGIVAFLTRVAPETLKMRIGRPQEALA
ncbi:MAG: cobalt transport protein CbiM [Methanomassiliicoccales archaeon PtaU1.Bin124]|nr:MAG: cobalt transport protein CbiM [Methanomassiliicoccales archaeon PtaU1.Bin124]